MHSFGKGSWSKIPVTGQGTQMELNSHEPTGPIEKRWDKHRFEMKLVNPVNKRKFDVIVVGAGLAGASAAADGPWWSTADWWM